MSWESILKRKTSWGYEHGENDEDIRIRSKRSGRVQTRKGVPRTIEPFGWGSISARRATVRSFSSKDEAKSTLKQWLKENESDMPMDSFIFSSMKRDGSKGNKWYVYEK